jgi:hypothetical protein
MRKKDELKIDSLRMLLGKKYDHTKLLVSGIDKYIENSSTEVQEKFWSIYHDLYKNYDERSDLPF